MNWSAGISDYRHAYSGQRRVTCRGRRRGHAINQAIQSSNDMAAAAVVQQQVDNNLANMPTFGQ
jgi:hypothetical protein